MIIQITPENFESEVLKSEKPVALAFMIKEGCKFCDEFKTVFAKYALEHPEIKCVVHMQDTLNSKPSAILEKYGVNRFPNAVSFKNGIKRKTNQGMAMSEAVLDEMLKFLEDMDDEELASRKVNVNIEMAQIQLEMAKMQGKLFSLKTLDNKIEEEAMRRANVKVPNSLDMKKPMDPPEDFPLNIPTIKPEDQVPCDGCQ